MVAHQHRPNPDRVEVRDSKDRAFATSTNHAYTVALAGPRRKFVEGKAPVSHAKWVRTYPAPFDGELKRDWLEHTRAGGAGRDGAFRPVRCRAAGAGAGLARLRRSGLHAVLAHDAPAGGDRARHRREGAGRDGGDPGACSGPARLPACRSRSPNRSSGGIASIARVLPRGLRATLRT